MITLRSQIDEVLSKLPEAQLRQVLQFASQLTEEEEQAEWHELGRQALDRAYGADEPEYSQADCKVRY